MSLGSLAQSITPFERTFILKPRTSATVTDGYIIETVGTSRTFKGTMIGRPMEQLLKGDIGKVSIGDGSLVVRTEGQEFLPEILDEIVDELGVSWIILARRDYDVYAKVYIYDVRRKV